MDYVLCHKYEYGESKSELPFGGNPDGVNPNFESYSHNPDKINQYRESKIQLPFFANSDGVKCDYSLDWIISTPITPTCPIEGYPMDLKGSPHSVHGLS